MSNPRSPASQPYYGPMYGDMIAQQIPHLGGPNPNTVARMRNTYGRYLAGLGGEDMSGAAGYDPRYQGQEIYDLEGEDDTFGSGIFDPEGRGGTANANLGVFASHYSWPGYDAREVPFTVQRDVTDITDDAAVVSVPGGGLWYVEKGGKLSGAAPMGPTWRPPQIEPAGHTRRAQTYAMLNRPNQRGHYLFPGHPVTGPPRMRPRRVQTQPVHQVPGVPRARAVPSVPATMPVRKRSIANMNAPQTPIAIERYRHPVAAAAPGMPTEPQVPFMQTANVATQRIPILGVGSFGQAQQCPGDERWDDDIGACACPSGMESTGIVGECRKKPMTTTQLAVAGAVIGVVSGILVGVVKKGKM